jgi:hypothetical protein
MEINTSTGAKCKGIGLPQNILQKEGQEAQDA